MKQIIFVLTALVLITVSISCNNQGTKKEIASVENTANVNIYYFHFTNRCATCLAVEENARKAVEILFPNEVSSGKYSFTSMNLDDSGTKVIADKYGIGGQTLVIVNGDKKIDITSAGFLNAHNLEKMKAEIKSGVDKVLL